MRKAGLFLVFAGLVLAFGSGLFAEEGGGFTSPDPFPLAAPTSNKRAMDFYNLGTIFLYQNNLVEAEKYLTQAITLDRRYVDAMDHLGLVYRRQGRYDEAEKIYLQSIMTNDQNIVPLLNLAIIYKLQNRLNDSLEQYKKVRELDPENPEPFYGIGELFYLAKNYTQALVFLREAEKRYAAAKSAYIYDAWYHIGMCYYGLENFDEALWYLEEARKRYPENETINRAINTIQERKNSGLL